MSTKIAFVTNFPDAADAAREMTPSGFELMVVAEKSAEYVAAMKDAEFLVGFVDGLVEDELYEVGPNLKLVQLLSAGYDQADLDAARKAGVPLANNGGANSVAVSEHAILLMLAVNRQLVRQHTGVVFHQHTREHRGVVFREQRGVVFREHRGVCPGHTTRCLLREQRGVFRKRTSRRSENQCIVGRLSRKLEEIGGNGWEKKMDNNINF